MSITNGKRPKDHGKLHIARCIGGDMDSSHLKVLPEQFATKARAIAGMRAISEEGVYRLVRIVGPLFSVEREVVTKTTVSEVAGV